MSNFIKFILSKNFNSKITTLIMYIVVYTVIGSYVLI